MATGAPPRWLCLLGTSGAGKTLLADLILAAVKRYKLTRSETSLAGITYEAARRMNFEVSLARMLDSREWGRFEDLARANFLVVDDIATRYVPADVSTPKLASMAERRLGKWTVWTCNLSLEEIKSRLDTRIASRMLRHGSDVVDVNVPDFNLRQRNNQAEERR